MLNTIQRVSSHTVSLSLRQLGRTGTPQGRGGLEASSGHQACTSICPIM